MCCIDKIVEEIYIGKGYCYDQTFYNRGGEDSFRRESCYVKLPMNVYFERNLENSLDRVPFQMAVYAARKRISFNFDHICITIPLPQETTSDAVQLSGTKYANFSPFLLLLSYSFFSFFSKHHNSQFMYMHSSLSLCFRR